MMPPMISSTMDARNGAIKSLKKTNSNVLNETNLGNSVNFETSNFDPRKSNEFNNQKQDKTLMKEINDSWYQSSTTGFKA